MKWMLGLVLGLSCISGVVCAGNSTSSINKANDQILLEKLIEACEEDNINEAGNIINNIKNLNCHTIDGTTVLMIISAYGYEKIVRILLEHGVDANAQRKDGITALIVAAKKGHEEIVKMLLDYKVDANIRDYDGATALILAADNGYERIVELLLDYKVDANMQAEDGDTALILAADNGYEKIVEMLLKYGVDANAYLNTTRATALILAVDRGYERIVELLLKYGIDANAQCKNGATALMIAVDRGYERIVELLLDYKVDANIQDCDGDTALIMAVEKGYEKIVRVLLEHGVNSYLQRKNGITALIIAVGKGNKKIAELLIEHGAYTELKIKANNHTAFDVLDNLSDYSVRLEGETIQYLKYILNGARAVERSGLKSALSKYNQAKEMLVKRELAGINESYKEDLAIGYIKNKELQSSALALSDLLFPCVKAKLESIQDNYESILDKVYEDEYFKQQAIEVGHFAGYQSKKYIFGNLLKASREKRFSDIVVSFQ